MALSEETKLAFLSKHDVEHIETQFPSLRKNFDEAHTRRAVPYIFW